jgi:hypothetical protein
MFQKIGSWIDKFDHNLSYKEGEGWSKIYGGTEGQAFNFGNRELCLIGVKGTYRTMIDSLQFLFVNTKNGQFITSPEAGTNQGGQPFFMECPPWVYISKITVWTGSLIDAIQFEASNGTTTPKYGGNGGSPHIIDPKGEKICEVKGRST